MNDEVTRMLFKMTQLDDVASGKIKVAYRRWTRPTVKKGGTLRTPACILAIDDVTKLPKSARITKADAAAAGFPSVDALKKALSDEGDLYRVRFHPAGEDERATLRTKIAMDADDVHALDKALAKLDARKPWTLDTLALIEAHPATLAARLAEKVKRETLDFKNDVRKLKGLGLTESLDVGYRLSPRGLAWLDRARPARVRPARDQTTRLPDDVIAALTRGKIMGVRAGDTHKFVGVWPVVVDGHLYARSWSASDGGWWRAFPKEHTGAVHVSLWTRGTKKQEREVAVRAVAVTDEDVLEAVDAEYRRKYATPGAAQYVKDLCGKKSRATTTEFVPR
jgi:hypothetical protein